MANTAIKFESPWHVEAVLIDTALQARLNAIYQSYGRVDVSILPASNPFNCYVIWCEPGE